ncbi:hypothetical protein K227x_16980 [Rubripirellula lacrimiformis]|uniref:Uncharacterized protein n=1 Tax=Rubripirellula lacrimiformis TaxID=1930273 RepID=A0A517N850_9BACT|nr:hypothetical protein [Rubripirellula lacrimiformis]QDT03316.1 hypothetical protein K227x_16980 [Rubripirellula lacrimiformis]
MSNATKRLIWIPTVLLTNVAVWYALQGFGSLAVLAASLCASFIAREIVGSIFYVNRIYHESIAEECAKLTAEIETWREGASDGDDGLS